MSNDGAKKEIHLEHSSLKFPLPEGLLKELSVELHSMNEYPSGEDYDILRTKLAEYTGTPADNVLVANGSDEVIEAVTRAFGSKLILIPVPTFSQYEISANRNGFEKKLVPCLKGYHYQLNYSKDDLRQASLVWICNPNNPTGSPIPREDIINILNSSPGIVVVDECNYEYLGETVVDLIDEFPNLIVSRSFSKNFGLAGFRLGFALSSPQNIHEVARYCQIFRVNRMAEVAGSKVLKYLDYFQKIWQEVALVREYFISGLKSIDIETFPSRSNFVLADFATEKKARRAWQYLREKKVFTSPSWDEEYTGLEKHFIRFAIGNKKEMGLVLRLLTDFQKLF